MGELTQVAINFETSHLLFPKIIAIVLGLLGLAIVLRDHARIVSAGSYWHQILTQMDKVRFFGTLLFTFLYFALMVPIGNFWPNTGLGFLVCSIPFVLLIGLLYMHGRGPRQLIPLGLVVVIAPTFVWWLFTYPFFLTLP